MSGYGHDESAPTPGGVFATNFVGVRTHLWNVRNVFVFCVLHIRRAKVWFLACKNPLFTLQKPPF